MAPRAGLEPATLKLTASCSTIELPGIVYSISKESPTKSSSEIFFSLPRGFHAQAGFIINKFNRQSFLCRFYLTLFMFVYPLYQVCCITNIELLVCTQQNISIFHPGLSYPSAIASRSSVAGVAGDYQRTPKLYHLWFYHACQLPIRYNYHHA